MRPRLRAVLAILGWMLAVLVLIDVVASLAFPLPADPQREPSSMARYFNYGRSVESKLDGLVGADDAHSAPIVVSGWIGRECVNLPIAASPGRIGVTVYGMSFSNNVAHAMAALDRRIEPTLYAGPGAPVSHSVACSEELRRHGRDPNRFRIIGVLGSSVGRLVTLGGLTTSFEAPMPFSYPRYRPSPDGRLLVEQPLVQGPEDLRDHAKRTAYFAQLAAHDGYYDRWLMQADLGDRSAFLKMLRRAYGQAETRHRRADLLTGKNKALDPQLSAVLGRLLLRFAQAARADGAVPIVLLLQDQGDPPDMLERNVAPLLRANGIAYVSSLDVAPNTDPGKFVPDGHFTEAVSETLARRVLAIVDAEGAGKR